MSQVLQVLRRPNNPVSAVPHGVAGVTGERIWVWGVPFSPVTFGQTVDAIDGLIDAGLTSFVITANLHYAMLSAADERLRANNDRAALVLADGMPIVWASRWRSRQLPERVTGSDLFPMLCERAAQRGHRLFFLGAAPGVAADCAKKMSERFPGLCISGVLAPPFRDLCEQELLDLCEQIRNAKPDILFVAFGQPKGEYWVADWCDKLGVPVVMQVGATLDFVAGRVSRAPRWMQRSGLEWFYRMLSEPRRLVGRYAANAWFAVKMIVRDLFTRRDQRR